MKEKTALEKALEGLNQVNDKIQELQDRKQELLREVNQAATNELYGLLARKPTTLVVGAVTNSNNLPVEGHPNGGRLCDMNFISQSISDRKNSYRRDS